MSSEFLATPINSLSSATSISFPNLYLSIKNLTLQIVRSFPEAAQRQGFLKIPVTGSRPNVLNVYKLWCQAEGRDFIVKGGPEG